MAPEKSKAPEMILARWRARRANRILIDQIHGEIVAAARAPTLFRDFAVPDDLDGRFEMVTLHCGLVLRRLSVLGPTASSIAQDLVDCVFQSFEDALREMSISDAGVAKRMKTMAGAFYGRNKVYADALAAHDIHALAAALARNAYRGATTAETSLALATRVAGLAGAIEFLPIQAFAEGRFRFPRAVGDAP
jgi:cytochrome b pre-mRNA-processing protein 3